MKISSTPFPSDDNSLGSDTLLNRWKKKIEKFFNPIGKALSKTPISPDTLSLLGFLSMLSAVYFIYLGNLSMGVLFILLSGLLDLMDGLVARMKGKVTKFGGVLDSILDRYSDAVLYIVLIYGGYVSEIWGLLALIGSLLVSYSRARIEAVGVKMSGVGFLERPERLLIITISLILYHFDLMFNPIEVGSIIIAILTQISVLQRVHYGYKVLKEEKMDER
ncbi:MAG: archaetidylinositol phosphate synthase [Candidatus Asgardarchaeia archaeon]